MATFRLQIGYQNPLANFRSTLKGIAAADAIPDYHIALVEGPAAEPEQGKRGRKAGAVTVVITPKPRLLGADESPPESSAA